MPQYYNVNGTYYSATKGTDGTLSGAQQVSSIPTGASTITWNGQGLPSDLQTALGKPASSTPAVAPAIANQTPTLGAVNTQPNVAQPNQTQTSTTNPPAAPPPVAPPQTTISNPVTPPTAPATGTYTPPQGTAPAAADQFNTSLTGTLNSLQQQLAQALSQSTQSYQTQINALRQQQTDYQQMQQMGLAQENSLVAQEGQQKQAALEQEQAQFTANFNARQALVGQLQTLLGTGQSIIEGMKATTGLASIMNPRIAQTMSDVQGQAGVITAALSAYDSQIGLAQSQLKTAVDAIGSIYGDQINYWQSVVSFYDKAQSQDETAIAQLSGDQKLYIDAQIKLAQDQINSVQKNADSIMQAMLDPKSALDYAKAGVSLADSPEQINLKLAIYEQSVQKQWGPAYQVGTEWVQKNAVTGEIRSVVGSASTKPAGGFVNTTPFSNTQLNKGAANASMPISDFAKLDSTTQNWFVNSYDSYKSNLNNMSNQKAADYVAADTTLTDSVKSQLYAMLGTKPSGPGLMSQIWGGVTSAGGSALNFFGF